MQAGHLCSKTLKSIIQTRDVAAKNGTRNFGNQKNILWYSLVNEIEFTYTIFHSIRT